MDFSSPYYFAERPLPLKFKEVEESEDSELLEGTSKMLTRNENRVRRVWNRRKMNSQPTDKYWDFRGSEKNYIKYGAWVVEESISLFHGKASPIRHFSVDDLNKMNVEKCSYYREGFQDLYRGIWEGIVVLVKKPDVADNRKEYFLREIVVATQMVTHNNSHKILGCCLETECPVLVYEWMAHGTLEDCIYVREENCQNKLVLEWKDRLRIAWEISHAVAYLHAAFPRPIIHGHLTPINVFLDKDNTARLSDYSLSISIPEGEEFVEIDRIPGSIGYMAPEYHHGKVAESADVYSFGMLFLMLLTGKKPYDYYTDVITGETYDIVTELRTWVQNGVKNKPISNIVDPAITRTTVTTTEDLQLRASIELAIRCIAVKGNHRPTMVGVATELKNMITSTKEECIYRNFQGSKENFINNEATVLEESISFYHGRMNPIHYFSVDEVNNMNVELWHKCCDMYQGSWEGRAILVKLPESELRGPASSNEIRLKVSREIVVATQMASHDNVHKLLGCCLETKFPILVYEWMAAETLEDRILLKDEKHNKLPLLEWKDRLRIAGEISHLISDFHTAYHRPIILRNFELDNVFLDQDNTAKLSNFSRCVSIPIGGELLVEDFGKENRDSKWVAPEYQHPGRVAESIDVYSFGVLLLVLLFGTILLDTHMNLCMWALQCFKDNRISEILDPAIARKGVTRIEDHQLTACIQLAFMCMAREVYNRPTMVEVATKLKNMIQSSVSIPTTSLLQGEGICQVFRRSTEDIVRNESMVLAESTSLFHGRVDPIRYFSVDELNKMNVEFYINEELSINNLDTWSEELYINNLNTWSWLKHFSWYQGSWEGRAVFVKLSSGLFKDPTSANKFLKMLSREIVVATQMAAQNNVHKLLGCCLETKFPILVYEWIAAETLEDCILFRDENQNKLPLLEWKDRLRIAWEISRVVSVFHTTFHRPIILRNLEPDNVFLDEDKTAKLFNYKYCVSIPEGEKYVVEHLEEETSNSQWLAPECRHYGRVAECADVYSFGVLFLVLLTEKDVIADHQGTHIVKWVTEKVRDKRIGDIVDPQMNTNGVANTELSGAIELALRCTETEEGSRPTMVDVATELYNMIKSSESIPITTSTGV
ncbi:uncharacterized protein LOC104902961 [Beta vulgaris subsp. vulgaris]|uniref:uncharacterized protein LOC104902961 n=1 Tax=Beta vulgaris subsp. vulgaris TaxID=3555 RepID=UPI0020374233|nr:uncharacterized protein LOC104902961 [Beta vulgaris subsp. vulgaris]